MKKTVLLVFAVLVFGTLGFGKTITGVVSDSHCGAKHAAASDAAAQCVNGCVSKGATYVLVANGKVYQLDDQDKFKDFAGKSVKVTGSVSGDSIKVASVMGAS